MTENIIWFDQLGMNDVDKVGGKNASLGEMISNLSQAGVSVPSGFATTSHAFQTFLLHNNLTTRINEKLAELDVNDVDALVKTGAMVRQWVLDADLQADLLQDVTQAYEKMSADRELAVAVRSSATAEDLPDASFAGQQETFLNVRGLEAVLTAIKHVFASLYNDRAISYRVHQDFEHSEVALSAGIQRMVKSESGTSGVMFTLDTESGFSDVVFITGAYGLGETVVQGSVNPDEFYLYKPALRNNRFAVLSRAMGSKETKMVYTDNKEHGKTTEIVKTSPEERGQFCLNDAQLHELAKQAVTIETHYGRPMDIEWALDGEEGKLYIVQARPETVKSRDNVQIIERFHLKETSNILSEGRAIGQKIGSGQAKVLKDISEMDSVQAGDVLVTDMTDPDWEPVMKRASAIVTNRGGRTCHAAIIARELGVPAVVGCGNATDTIANNQAVTVSCAEGETGHVYEGNLDFELQKMNTGKMPDLDVKVMMNIGNPTRAFDFSMMPNAGIGLARLEFIINSSIGIHPKALLEFDLLPADLQAVIKERMQGYDDPVKFYVDKLSEGISTLAAAFFPKPVIVRLSDFKSNEYANLLAGVRYEPNEENPMIGFRGASRYVSKSFRPCFELECQAIKKVRNEMGLDNVEIMIPFVRTVKIASQVIDLLKDNGLERGKDGLRVLMMCELPSNAVLAEEFLQYFDGFSIGSNDLTQLTLGLDRDSALVASAFDERNPAVKKMLKMAITACQKKGKYVGICGQGPSDYPDLAKWLMEEKITSISLNPDSLVETWFHMAGMAN